MAKKGSHLTKIKYETSQELFDIIGIGSISRPQLMKELWIYIKANKLQDEDDGRIIHCDAALKKVYGKAKIKMTEVGGKKVSEHLFRD